MKTTDMTETTALNTSFNFFKVKGTPADAMI